jgi:hypothetical protein
MTDNNLVEHCRYCLDCENPQEFITPCKCKGSVKYIHRYCLINYLNIIRDKSVLPFKPNQYKYCCELCKTEYQVDTSHFDNGESLYQQMIFSFCTVTLSLVSCYFITGTIAYFTTSWWPSPTDNLVLEMLFKGFVITHVALALTYFLISISNIEDNLCLCCFSLDVQLFHDNDACAALLIILAIILLSFSVICVFGIYVDVLRNVYRRNKVRKEIIVDVKNYPEPPNMMQSPEHFRSLDSPVDL